MHRKERAGQRNSKGCVSLWTGKESITYATLITQRNLKGNAMYNDFNRVDAAVHFPRQWAGSTLNTEA